MDGFTIEEDEERAGRKEDGDSLACLQVYAQHRRSRSVSDRNLDLSSGAISHSIKKKVNVAQEQPLSKRSWGTRTPLHEYSTKTFSKTGSSHRTCLEKDIEHLHLRLEQEKSMRMMLERAMGRASSTLSPGHRHFASQTKELITEIELLEEEVANREQHVLTLYRSIFENCVSRPSSEQSSVTASPAHTKNETRKHPSIISSAFCSSKDFPLRPFQTLGSKNGPGRRSSLQSKTRHASFFGGKTNICFEKTCSDHVKVKEKVPKMENTPAPRTLKDHLYQCPSKLSEEMVRCMAAVYCWLSSTDSTNLEQKRSPLLSRSSTNVVLPRRPVEEDKDWSRRSTVEISSISTDKNHFSRASYCINNYRVLVEQLEKVNVNQMESSASTAFWINVYNSLIMHAYLAYGVPHNSLRRLALFHKAAYNISGHIISANAIEQSIFCFRTPRIGRWLETILSTAFKKRSGEELQLISSKFSLPGAQPIVCFAFCTGAFSDPMLNVYSASNVKDELEAAKREFLQANVIVKKSKKVFLPKLLERFSKESSISLDDLLKWVAENVDKKLQESIMKCIDGKTKKKRKTSQIIEWLPYSSSFRYLFSKDLTEKPWWM